jgi:hypothetical protein
VAKTLSKQELAELGASVEVKRDPEVREIARLGELIDKLSQMIDQGAERTRADLDRSQVQLEVLSSLQKMIRHNTTKSCSPQKPIDLSPIREMLAEISASREAVPYRFDIQRHEGGAMASVTAIPIAPTKH